MDSFNVNFNGDFDKLSREIQSSVNIETDREVSQIVEKLRATGVDWEVHKTGPNEYQFSTDLENITKEFGSPEKSGSYRVTSALRSAFGGSTVYRPTEDKEYHRRALQAGGPRQPLIEKQLSPERQINPLREKLRRDLENKSKAIDKVKHERDLIKELLGKDNFSPLQKTIIHLLITKATTNRRPLDVKTAHFIHSLTKAVPRKLPSYKQKLLIGMVLRTLKALPGDHLLSPHTLDALITMARQTYIFDGKNITRVNSRSILERDKLVEQKNKFTAKKDILHNGYIVSTSQFDQNFKTANGKSRRKRRSNTD